MKQVFRRLILLFGLLLSGAQVACSADTHDKNPDTVQVQVPWFSGGNYSSQTVTLHTVKDMVTLQGDSARFLMSPGSQDGKLTGLQPKIRTMRTQDGIYVPEDYLSAQLLTLYAHFEKLSDLDVELGLNQSIQNWPRQQTIAVSVQTIDPTGQYGSDNAMYTGDYDAFLFLPYDRPDLPFSVNAGVIGHEHFHSLFFQQFIKPAADKYPFSAPTAHPVTQLLQAMGLPVVLNTESQSSRTTDRDQYHAYLLRSLNEGLADVWGWVYSGDSRFVERSARGQEQRRLDFNSSIPLSTGQIMQMATSSRVTSSGITIDGSAYQIGTAYSHRLWQAVQNSLVANKMSEIDARKKLAQGIMRAVVRLQSEFSGYDATIKLDPLRPLQLIQEENPELKINVNIWPQ